MAKRYDINSINGTEFTYQLYANLNPQVSGSTAVTASAAASPPGDLFASFTVSGAAVPADPLIQQFGVEFLNGATSISIYTAEAYSPSQQPPTLAYSYAGSTNVQQSVDPNGDYEIFRVGTTHVVYKDSVEIGTMTPSAQLFADTATPFEAFPSAGLISNIVLGS